jgi:isoleucyl-tRNA synthetase
MSVAPFEPVPTEIDFPKYERQILRLWQERRVFERSQAANAEASESFVFYEGPPTANGLPHNGHVLTRVMKDVYPRYQSMLGKRVLRKGGWDTHGLPVEVEVEKELRIHGREAIVNYGVEPFVARCIDSVFRYTTEWENLDQKLAFWVSHDDAYVTYHKSYVESCWWALSELFARGLLYQGHKVLWWWAQGGTALSSGEVGMGYKTVDDPAATVGLPLVRDPSIALAIWTTTPWTLPSNAYAAVNPRFEYVQVSLGEPLATAAKAPKARPELSFKSFIVAAGLREKLEQQLGYSLVIEATLTGAELLGERYLPPFDGYHRRLGEAEQELRAGGRVPQYFRVIGGDFVSLDSGTGIVHIAPAFGEDDHKAHQRELAAYRDPAAVELLCAVEPNGKFTAAAGRYEGRWIKDCDEDIQRELAAAGRLILRETYRHDYPFCWRADDDPLIQLARPAWFIRTTERLDDAKANNRAVSWLPTHIQTGRFGDFLENNVDWALSRERFWGTPLNVWVCSLDAEHKHAPVSVAEILSRNPEAFAHWERSKAENPKLNDHLMVHKPWIDAVTFPCPRCGATMNRVPEVIDVWFDSGCMPFAQWGFPHKAGSREAFAENFPADFISEAIDQTRGWFYSLLMVSSLVFDSATQARLGLDARPFPHPYKHCIVLGHVGDREGRKESKSRGNYTPPEVILDRVQLDFAVVDASSVAGAEVPGADEVLIGREDLEGLDLKEGATVSAFRPDREAAPHVLKVRVAKQLARRIALVAPAVRTALGLELAPRGATTRVPEVPLLPPSQRLRLYDAATPAPGADAFRWFFYGSSPPWTNTRHSLHNVRLMQKDFLVKLRNVYSFFTIYANIDGWWPNASVHPAASASEALSGRERPLLDRWILSELQLTVQRVRSGLDNLLSYDAAQCLQEFAESLSNWYLRRSRARFWGPGLSADKQNAYTTLHTALLTLAHLLAPFVPFFAEELYQNLAHRVRLAGAPDSVHLARFPEVDRSLIDNKLAQEMAAVREVVSLGLRVRTAHKLKVRQPLSRADVVFNQRAAVEYVRPHLGLVREELNVHDVRLMHARHEEGAVTFEIKPNFRALGPRLGKRVQAAKQVLAQADGGLLYAELARTGGINLTIDGETVRCGPEEIAVTASAAEGFAADSGPLGVVVLHTELTKALLDEGLLREVMSRVQAARKDARLDFAARIHLQLDATPRLRRVLSAGQEHLATECLAASVVIDTIEGEAETFELGADTLRLKLEPVG